MLSHVQMNSILPCLREISGSCGQRLIQHKARGRRQKETEPVLGAQRPRLGEFWSLQVERPGSLGEQGGMAGVSTMW